MSTLADPRHRASDPQVKTESRFGETPRKRWWQRTAQTDPAVERSTFPAPDAPTQVIPPVPTVARKPATPPQTPKPQVLYRERPADLDIAAYNIALAATNAGLRRSSATKLKEDLALHLRVLDRLAQKEHDEALKLIERPKNADAATDSALESLRDIAEAERRANELAGVSITAEVDTKAYGSDLGAVWTNAHALSDDTAHFEPIRPDTPDPRLRVTVKTDADDDEDVAQAAIGTVTVAQAATAAQVPGSPLHLADGKLPPIPAEDEVADPGAGKPLPKRVPQRRPVDVLPYSDLDPYAAVDPTVEGQGLVSGAWVFDEGTGSGGPVWFLLAEAAEEGQARDRLERRTLVVLKFANGFTREVDAGKQVRVLDVRRAQVLLAEHEQKLAARDAENAGAER